MARDATVPGAHYSIVAFSGYVLSEQILIFRQINQAQHEDSLRSIPEKIVLSSSQRNFSMVREQRWVGVGNRTLFQPLIESLSQGQ